MAGSWKMFVLLPASQWIALCLQRNASALWLCCLICKIKEECFPAACFLGNRTGTVPSGGECYGSAKPRTLSQCIHNLFIQHQFLIHSLFWVHKCGFLLLCMKVSANRSDPLVSLLLFCVFQLHIFTQLPSSKEGVRTSTGGPCWLGEWKTDLQECAGRWRYPVPGAEWSQATF